MFEKDAKKVKAKIGKEKREQRAAQSYRLQTGYALFPLQTQNASALHAISNTYVKKNGGDGHQFRSSLNHP